MEVLSGDILLVILVPNKYALEEKQVQATFATEEKMQPRYVW